MELVTKNRCTLTVRTVYISACARRWYSTVVCVPLVKWEADRELSNGRSVAADGPPAAGGEDNRPQRGREDVSGGD